MRIAGKILLIFNQCGKLLLVDQTAAPQIYFVTDSDKKREKCILQEVMLLVSAVSK